MDFRTSVTATKAHLVRQGHTSKAPQNSAYCGQTVQMPKAFRENLIQTITLTKPALIDRRQISKWFGAIVNIHFRHMRINVLPKNSGKVL